MPGLPARSAIAIAQSAALGTHQTTTALVAYGLFAAAEHVFLLAPPLFLPLGLILLRIPLLPRAFALLAVTFGITCGSRDGLVR